MSIETELIQTSDNKQSIKTSIEAKKGSSVDGDFSTYAVEIDNLPSGGSNEVGTKAWYDDQRADDWLDIESLVTEADRATGGKIVLLLPVYESGAWFRFRCADDFTIDWGDGNTESLNNAYTEHNYNFSDLDIGTLTSSGFRQAIITITPTTGSLSYFIPYSLGNKNPTSPLELIGLGNDIAYMRTNYMHSLELYRLIGSHSNNDFGIADAVGLKYLEINLAKSSYDSSFKYLRNQIDTVLDLSSTNSLALAFQYANNIPTLQNNLSTPCNCSYMYGLSTITKIAEIDYSLGTNFNLFLYVNKIIQKLPEVDLLNSTNNLRIVESCSSLHTMNFINCKSSIDFKNCNSLPLGEIIKFGLTGIVDLTGETSQAVTFVDGKAEDEIRLLDDGITTYHYNGIDYTQSEILALFTDKNWTVTY